MKKVKKIQGNGFYLLEGINSASTHLIENQVELDQFLIFVNAHFRHYMTIYDYCVTPVGWNLLVKIKDDKTVLKIYEGTQKRKNKALRLNSVCLIISNQVRLFRSRMTNWTNRKRGREGNASKSVYRRYIFDSLEEGQSYIKKVRNQELNLDQRNPRYRAIESHFDEDNMITLNSEKLSSKSAQENIITRKVYLDYLEICDYVLTRLEKWINLTNRKHGVVVKGVSCKALIT